MPAAKEPKPRPDYKFSYSEKRDIVICPHRYELITIQQVPQDFNLRRLLVPNVLDLALTTWVQNSFSGPLEDIVVDRYRKYATDNNGVIAWKHPMDYRECELKARDYARRLEAAMKASGLVRPDAVAQPWLKTEVKLTNGQTIRLTGRLDLLYRDEGWIFDMKVTENEKWLDKKQLIYYDFGMSIQEGRKMQRAGFLAPGMDQVIQEIPKVGKAEWEELFEELNFAMQTLTSGHFPDLGNTSEDCFLCFAKKWCKRYAGGGPSNVVQIGKSRRGGF